MTSSIIYSVAVASRIDESLYYTAEDITNIDGIADVPPPKGTLVVVPLGSRQVVGVVLSQQQDLPEALENVRLKSIQQLFPQNYWLSADLVDLLTWASRYYHHPLGKVLSTALPNAVTKARPASLKQTTVWQSIDHQNPDSAHSALSRTPRQADLYRWLLDRPLSTKTQIKAAGFATSLLRQLQDKELVKEVAAENDSAVETPEFALSEVPQVLTSQQANALKQLQNNGNDKPFLLEGVTGSGKTEVYLHAAASALQAGKQVLVLVPEIGLVGQIKAAFANRFNAKCYVYNSESSDTEKLDTWRAAKSGEPALFIGTRSAVFLPITKPGLMIVDEEHDLSYKQQEGFRYQARDLATIRSRALEIPLILGSATPSLETYRNVQTGAYTFAEMAERVSGVALPKISLQERLGGDQILSPPSLLRIAAELKNNAQVLIFLNRRGFAPKTLCKHCGWLATCPHCDTSLCRHLRPPQLICHHCNHRASMPSSCPSCASSELNYQGLGTEQVEQYLRSVFPDTDCIRIDRDSTSRKGSFQKQIESASAGGPCILIGTQMLAKGHHLSALKLALICEADQALFSHDYRAAEHLGQLVTQVAGRTGRQLERGELIIETAYPNHPLWEHLIQNSYRDFSGHLATERAQRQLPPFAYSAVLRAEGKDFRQLLRFMDIAKGACDPASRTVEVLGPMPAVIERKSGRYRYLLWLKASERRPLHQSLSALSHQLKNVKQMSQIRWVIDVDPQTID